MINKRFWHTKMIMLLTELQNLINPQAWYYVKKVNKMCEKLSVLLYLIP